MYHIRVFSLPQQAQAGSPMIGAFYWFRGIDIYDQNRVYAANYWNISDQFVGPSISSFDPESEAAFYSLYNRNWYIHRATIDSFIEEEESLTMLFLNQF